MKRVLLLSMPFGALERPALGLSLLKAQLERDSILCDVCYFNFAFAEFIGCDSYQWIGYDLPHTAFAGDWLFTAALYGENAEADREPAERSSWRGLLQVSPHAHRQGGEAEQRAAGVRGHL